MMYTWFFIITPVAIVAVVAAAWFFYRRVRQERDLKHVAVIAHTHTVKMLPEYRKAERHYRVLMIAAALSFLASAFTFTAVAARPTSRQERDTTDESRDVVLCMDISGSMDDYQDAILSYFKDIIDSLHGQRIGLTIFDGAPASLIPLTDDYDAAIELVSELSTNFPGYSSATYSVTNGSSAIGDGVMGCISNLVSDNDYERSKNLIIATDNYAGSETVDINQAARYAKRLGVTFYGLSTGVKGFKNDALFQAAALDTGGSFYNIQDLKSSKAAIGEIIQKILEQQTAKITGSTEVVYVDSPNIMLYISAICFSVFLVLIWRLRL